MRIDLTDAQGLLAFAEHLISNIGAIWLDANLDQRQRIQRAIFPEGLPFHGRAFGTGVTCLAFSDLRLNSDNLASLSPASWNQIVCWLEHIEALRQSGVLAGASCKPYSSRMRQPSPPSR